MAEPKRPHLPIGYWLRKADEALTTRINAVQQATGLTRTDWQVLNVLTELASTTREQLAQPLRPFAEEAALGEVVARLSHRGLLQGDGSAMVPYRITSEGKRLHEAALELQMTLRHQAVLGVSEADYAATLRVLQQIVHNLESGATP